MNTTTTKAAYTPGLTVAETGMLDELRSTKLPRHHRDMQDAAEWAAAKIETLLSINAVLRRAAQLSLHSLEGLGWADRPLAIEVRAAITKSIGAA